MLDVSAIIQLQQNKTEQWHLDSFPPESPKSTQDNLLSLIEENHYYNYALWHEEDKARRDDQGFEYVYTAKRNIDHFNQKRNNAMEKIDQWMMTALSPAQSNCPANSESPGMIIDRLSILALKEYHMRKQAERSNVTKEHSEKCAHKLAVIQKQLQDLQNSLNELLEAVLNKERSFHIYYQFKMYNDPSLNPQLYT